jgi:hypothetical protein
MEIKVVSKAHQRLKSNYGKSSTRNNINRRENVLTVEGEKQMGALDPIAGISLDSTLTN